ncbi:hypothetical protein LTR17_009166 [Elasticomyces elasticus]|nr:hypothetical protein LTR17_009166 [Elasticomyces elasticus]
MVVPANGPAGRPVLSLAILTQGPLLSNYPEGERSVWQSTPGWQMVLPNLLMPAIPVLFHPPVPSMADLAALVPIYRLNVRNPDPRRFATQYPGPHSVHRPPPPAQNLFVLVPGTNPNPQHGAQLVGKLPAFAQPPMQSLGPNPIITEEEKMTFGPNWYQIPEVAMCAVRNGYTIPQLVALFFRPGGPPSTQDEETAAKRLRKQISLAAKLVVDVGGPDIEFKATKARNDLGAQPDLTAAAWELYGDYIGGTGDFYATVPANDFPTGAAAGVFTKCLHFAMNNPHLNLDTSHIEWIIQTQGY